MSAGIALPILQDMLRTRIFEEACVRWFKDGLIPGQVYPSGGQEAIGVAACHALEAGDQVIPSFRTRGAFFGRGVPMVEQLRALLGSPLARTKCHEPPHHTSWPEYGVMPGSSMIGGQIPVAAGLALAHQMDGRDSVAMAFFGDGTLGAGDLHETMNMAAVWKLPLILVGENNGWQVAAPWRRARARQELAPYAEAFGLVTRQVDGNDAMDVYQAGRWARSEALAGRPVLLDCTTFRISIYSTHFGEPRAGIDDDLAHWRAKDPIERLRANVIDSGHATAEACDELRDEVEREVQSAFQSVRSELPAARTTAARP